MIDYGNVDDFPGVRVYMLELRGIERLGNSAR